jgi:hypothetical protein
LPLGLKKLIAVAGGERFVCIEKEVANVRSGSVDIRSQVLQHPVAIDVILADFLFLNFDLREKRDCAEPEHPEQNEKSAKSGKERDPCLAVGRTLPRRQTL